MSIVDDLRNGCICHRKRWSGDTHDDLGGAINEEETNALMDKAADIIEKIIPSLDLLQERLDDQCYIKLQGGRWHLLGEDGDSICSGETVREMLINLIFSE